jgi:hypothetical protein
VTDQPKFQIGALVVLINPNVADIPDGPVFCVEECKASEIRVSQSSFWWPEQIFRLAPVGNVKPVPEA